MKIAKRIEALQKQAEAALAESAELRALEQKLPDLEYDVKSEKYFTYISPSALKNAVKFHSFYSCSCCEDSVYYIQPYIEVDDRIIYASQKIDVGQRSIYHNNGRRYDWNALDRLKELGVRQEIIDEIQSDIDDCYYLEQTDSDELEEESDGE